MHIGEENHIYLSIFLDRIMCVPLHDSSEMIFIDHPDIGIIKMVLLLNFINLLSPDSVMTFKIRFTT